MMSNGVACTAATFTASQLEELHLQALIYKHMLMGVPVPPQLLLSVRTSLHSMPRFYQHPSLSYCTYFGKKYDPEPGRCRRTDGKKWRCAKDAYLDSKYCERHMHRGKNRSRKPVESQSNSQSPSPTASTVNSPIPDNRPFQGFVVPTLENTQLSFGSDPGACGTFQLEPSSFSSGTKDFRSHYGMKGAEVDEHSFFSQASGTARRIGMDSSLDSSWGLTPSQISSLPVSSVLNGSSIDDSYNQLPGLDDHLSQVSTNLFSRHYNAQQILLGNDFSSVEPAKRSQSLHPFFNEWPNARTTWTDFDEKSNRTPFSTTQLSISIPMATSDFSTSSGSPHW